VLHVFEQALAARDRASQRTSLKGRRAQRSAKRAATVEPNAGGR
jgi:hypothetical protein